jgi:hypothetical protein
MNSLMAFVVIVGALAVIVNWSRIQRWFASMKRNAQVEAKRPSPRPQPVENRALQEARLRYEAYLKEVTGLSVEQAKQRAEAALMNPRFWRCTPADGEANRLDREFNRSLQHLFSRWSLVEEAGGALRISLSETASYAWPLHRALAFGSDADRKARYLKIGSDSDGNPLVICPPEETLYIVYGTQSSSEKIWAADYPSIYHWLLIKQFLMEQ